MMERKPYRGERTPLEASKPPLPQSDADVVPPPGPLSEHGASLEARVRLKLARGEKLDAEEAELFAQLPGDRTIPAEEFQRRVAEREDRSQ